MKYRLSILIGLIFLGCLPGTRGFESVAQRKQGGGNRGAVYFPASGDGWGRKRPEEVGMDAALVEQAVAYAGTQESKVPRDFSTQVETFGSLLGPLPKERGETNGIIIRHGYIVAEWGDTKRIDPTYSVAKSFLS